MLWGILLTENFNKEHNMNYIFHCGEYETECSFEKGVDESYIDDAFDDWCFSVGFGVEEVEEMLAEGEAGYYEV